MSTASVSELVTKYGVILNDSLAPLAKRFRALFGLKSFASDTTATATSDEAVAEIARCFTDPSALLCHELAYCLGQTQSPSAVAALRAVLADEAQPAIVRHEAGEALGARGSPEDVEFLRGFETDSSVEVRETVQLALARIAWLQSSGDSNSKSIFQSVDPAPPDMNLTDTESLTTRLLDETLSLFDRYKAMFALRDKSDRENPACPNLAALHRGFGASSALFRHEIAFVLGQLASEHSLGPLLKTLEDPSEQGMVRHECAEALGSLANPLAEEALHKFRSDPEPLVSESCDIALDMSNWMNSGEFQFTSALST